MPYQTLTVTTENRNASDKLIETTISTGSFTSTPPMIKLRLNENKNTEKKKETLNSLVLEMRGMLN